MCDKTEWLPVRSKDHNENGHGGFRGKSHSWWANFFETD